MKEIAPELNFDDENYFSRYFKKHTGITPTAFRENVGISIAKRFVQTIAIFVHCGLN